MNAQELKDLRARLGVTQERLGKMLHRSRAAIAHYEAGEPIDAAVAELAKRLEESPTARLADLTHSPKG